jgi:hypothetical protein
LEGLYREPNQAAIEKEEEFKLLGGDGYDRGMTCR